MSQFFVIFLRIAVIDGPIIEDVTKAAEELQLQLGAGSNVTGVEHRPFDVNEERKIQEFCSRGCGCRLFNNAHAPPTSLEITTLP